MRVVPSASRKIICAELRRVGGGAAEGGEWGKFRKTKVVGWRVDFSVARRVESEVSPGGEAAVGEDVEVMVGCFDMGEG